MPIYEYRCPNGHFFEVFHGMNDPSPERCEICGAAPLERVLHPVAVHYKGSGFYSTDYGRGGRKGGKDSGSGESSAGGESSSGGEASSSGDSPSHGEGSAREGSGGKDGGQSKPSTPPAES